MIKLTYVLHNESKKKIENEKNFLIVLKKILLRFTQALVDKKQCLVQENLCFQIRFMVVKGSRLLFSWLRKAEYFGAFEIRQIFGALKLRQSSELQKFEAFGFG